MAYFEKKDQFRLTLSVPRGHPTTKDIHDGIQELKKKVCDLPIKRREEILV